jgi:hypothetical protein
MGWACIVCDGTALPSETGHLPVRNYQIWLRLLVQLGSLPAAFRKDKLIWLATKGTLY